MKIAMMLIWAVVWNCGQLRVVTIRIMPNPTPRNPETLKHAKPVLPKHKPKLYSTPPELEQVWKLCNRGLEVLHAA